MKKVIMSIIALMLFAGYAHAVPLFNVLDSTYHIYGAIAYTDGSGSYTDQYDITSNDPTSAMAQLEDSLGRAQSVSSTATAGYLYSGIIDENADPGAYAQTEAFSEAVFQPLFSGSSPTLTFYHNSVYPYGNNEFIITDDTLGIEIFNPGWALVSPGYRIVNFDYNSWDSSHTYTLRMSLFGSTDAVGFQEYEMGTDFFTYASVPEPATVAILGFGLLCLFGFRKKLMKYF